ncbi:MAG TPA: DUF4118 domain-containing protein [Kiritimatiellia bacterium]|nr:DUF4118 domain-containing protein [Kiritimatiellia bacterium]
MKDVTHLSIEQKGLILLLCTILSLTIDWVDWATGEKFELFAFYFIPVVAAAWYAGRRAGILLAFVSAAAWFQSDFLSQSAYSMPIGAWDTLMRLTAFVALALAMSRIRDDLLHEADLNEKLTAAMAEIKQLSGILPMCTFCRKIRDADNHWISLERYISDHSDAQISHGMCPVCYRKHYGDPNGT